MATDCLGRRSRFRRTPTGKRLLLTERDLAILRALYRYRYLRATQLVTLLRPRSEKRLIERLGDLYHEAGLIDRPPAQWRRFDARYASIVYELSAKGLQYLETCGPLPARAVTFARKNRAGMTPQFDHAMMIVDALVAVELATRNVSGQRFVPVDEILARAPVATRMARKPLAIPVTIRPGSHLPGLKDMVTAHVVPDALYGIEHLVDGEKRYRFYALECEHHSPKRRATAKLSSTALKRAAYEAVLQEGVFRDVYGVPNLALRLLEKRVTAPVNE